MLKSLFNNVASLQASNFIKKGLQHCCFPVKFAKFFRTTHFEEHLPKTASICFGKFGLDKTSTECEVFFFKRTILFNQMKLKNVSVTCYCPNLEGVIAGHQRFLRFQIQ